jgi:magnesium-transporting ATPase (P-type)
MKITGVITFFSYLLLLNTMLPISMFVTLEILKLTEAMFLEWDYHIYSIERDKPALVSSSGLMEELGQINYLFSDKTGTLTRNEMAMKALAIGSI